MEMRNAIMQERVKATVYALTRTVKFACAMAEADEPNGKSAVLDALIGELEEMAGRKKPCVSDGTCRNCEAPAENHSDPVTFGFGTAIEMLKNGASVARKGWNGKNQFVELATCISYKGNAGENDIPKRIYLTCNPRGVGHFWVKANPDYVKQLDLLPEDIRRAHCYGDWDVLSGIFIVNAHHNNIVNKALAFVGTSGVQLGWLASQADMLAEDWYVVK